MVFALDSARLQPDAIKHFRAVCKDTVFQLGNLHAVGIDEPIFDGKVDWPFVLHQVIDRIRKPD